MSDYSEFSDEQLQSERASAEMRLGREEKILKKINAELIARASKKKREEMTDEPNMQVNQ